MKVIGGALRGRRLRVLDEDLRPISGRIKQSLFDMLSGLVPGSHFLDLFAGTGAVGIEALSRGASFAFFVDKNRRCVAAIEENLSKAGLRDRGKAHPGNALAELSWIPFRAGLELFDLVFLGPPYKDEEKRPLAYSGLALSRVAEAGLLSPGGWMISQHHVKEEVPAPEGFVRARRQKYGDTYLDFFRRGD